MVNLQDSLHGFFNWLIDEALDNYSENPALKEDLRKTLEAAAGASKSLLRTQGA